MPLITHVYPEEIEQGATMAICPSCENHAYNLYKFHNQKNDRAKCADCFLKLITGNQVIVGES